MKVLVGFEESQIITIALRARGIEAYSNDLVNCSGNHPEWHLKMNYFDAIKLYNWHTIIIHPPCTFTAVCGNRWYAGSQLRLDGASLCKYAWEVAITQSYRVALEQPKSIMQQFIGQRSQTIHPWQFGHGETKETWLWLHNLPLLRPTHIVSGRAHNIWLMPQSPNRSTLRSKTYPGIAQAIASQWF